MRGASHASYRPHVQHQLHFHAPEGRISYTGAASVIHVGRQHHFHTPEGRNSLSEATCYRCMSSGTTDGSLIIDAADIGKFSSR